MKKRNSTTNSKIRQQKQKAGALGGKASKGSRATSTGRRPASNAASRKAKQIAASQSHKGK